MLSWTPRQLIKYVVYLRIHLIVPVGYYLSPYNSLVYASLV